MDISNSGNPEFESVSRRQCLKEELLDVAMANLCLGPLCTCSVENGSCKLRSKVKEQIEKRPAYPDFWRKTRANKILEHKAKFNKKKFSYEILKPSKLQFINPVQNYSQSNSVQLFNSDEISCVAGRVSEDNLRTPALSFPDLNGLKIRSQTDIALTRNPSSTLDFGKLSSLQWVKKPPKWKSRVKLNLKVCRLFSALATIPEDSEDLISEDDKGSQNPNMQTSQANCNALQTCSQQALTESNNNDDITIDELASYLDLLVHIPKKMSPMAEMMYT